MGNMIGYIGLDVGTSGCKASVITDQGIVIKTAKRDYPLLYPKRGYVELDPVVVWKKVKEVLAELAVTQVEIRMIAASSIGESLVLTDKHEKVIRNAITYLDQRGMNTTEEILKKIDEERIYRITGLPMRFFYSLNRILWMQKEEPDFLEKTEHAFMFSDYLVYMLAGEKLLDASTASKTMMLDVLSLNWSDEIMNLFNVPKEWFSSVVSPGTTAGKIRPELARELGLPPSVRIVVGSHDQCTAALGSGGITGGDLAASEGSTESLSLIVDKEKIREDFYKKRMCLEPYIQTGQYMVPAAQHTHGTSIRWFVNRFGADLTRDPNAASERLREEELYEIANKTCADDAGNVFFVPHLTSAHLMDADNRSLGTFIGMEVETGRPQMYRALLEGISFETRLCYDALLSTGFPINRIIASGGGSNSSLLMQLKADILEQKISILKNKNAGITALAMICAVADGQYGDYEQASRFFVKTEGEFLPKKDYRGKYEKYKKLYHMTKELYMDF